MMIAVLAFLLPVAGIAQCAGTSCDGQCAGTSCDDEGSPVSLLQVKVSTVAKKRKGVYANEINTLQDGTSETKSPSSTALGCISTRWALYSNGMVPRAWTDACFGSVTMDEVMPNPAMVSKWMKASCSCGTNPLKKTSSDVFLAPLMQGSAPLKENKARTIAIDDALDVLLAQTPNAQVVTLGSGFDGRFYSLPSLANASKLFEMDMVETQTLKKALVGNCKLQSKSPGGVHFFPLDLSKDNVYDALFNDNSFDAKLPTIFISEAVMQYVPGESVKKSLKNIASIMQRNPASRLILQSWSGDDTTAPKIDSVLGEQVLFALLDDQVLFTFPKDPSTRNSWWAELGFTSDGSPPIQKVISAFQQEVNTIEIPRAWSSTEYFDVLAPVESAKD